MKLFNFFSFLIAIPLLLFSETHYEVFVDPYFSPYMGSESIFTLHKSLEKKEDSFIKPTDPPKRGILPGLGRFLELNLFWFPVNSFADVVQHEVFGHGYRARSIHAGVASYSFDLPIPYGSGGGATAWMPTYSTTVGQFQAVTLAGLEAENILARQLKLKWLVDRRVDPRAKSLYEMAQLSSLLYSLVPSIEDNKIEGEEEELDPIFTSHDVEAYIRMLNTMYPDDFLSMHRLRQSLFWNLVDPMLYYGTAASWYYIFTGKSLYIPMIRIGPVSFLPNISVQLAPYGIEYYLENYLTYKNSPIYTYVKGGKHNQMEYFGCGIHYDEIIRQDNFSIGMRLDAWSQPNFLFNWTLDQLIEKERPINTIIHAMERKLGASASIVSRYRIKDTLTFFYSDLGYKTKGYLPGFPLQSSPTIRLGISAEF